jgi:hypothetical protein
LSKKQGSPPHHLDKFIGHVHFLFIKFHTICFKFVTVKPEKLAPFIGRLININKQEIINQTSRIFTMPETIQEKV